MSIRSYLFLLLAGSLNAGIIQAQWQIEKSPTRNNLNAIFFSSSSSGWIVGDKGTILKRSESGWTVHQNPTTEDLYSVFMVNESDGWAVGAKGIILHFDGKNWQQSDSPTRKNLLSVSFNDSKNGVAVGRFGTVVLYKNGIWSLIENKVRGDLLTADFKNDEIWFGGGLEAVKVPIMKMSLAKNGNELNSSLNSSAFIHSLKFVKPDNGWAVGSPSTVLHFDGQNWETIEISERFSSLKSVFFSDENNGISVGFNGTILTFSGDKWNKENSGVIQNLNGASISGNSYYAVGDNGTIVMKNNDAKDNITISEQQMGEIQLYPNPCDDFVNIVFPSARENPAVLITITNSFGQVFVQNNFNLENGNYTYEVPTKNLRDGLYILKTLIGGKLVVNKFIISH